MSLPKASRSPRVRTSVVIWLVSLILAIPVITTANPTDPSWRPGLYDEADSDQLITQILSADAMIGLTMLMLACLVSRWCPTDEVETERDSRSGEEPVPRRLPGPTGHVSDVAAASCPSSRPRSTDLDLSSEWHPAASAGDRSGPVGTPSGSGSLPCIAQRAQLRGPGEGGQ